MESTGRDLGNELSWRGWFGRDRRKSPSSAPTRWRPTTRSKKIAGNRPVFVEGWSLGTTVALCVTAARPVDGVVLVNPPPLRQLIVGEYSWWNLGLISHYIAGQVPNDLDSIGNASRSTAPVVILSAGSDETVPPKYQQLVINAYAGRKRVIDMPGRGHEDGLTHEAEQKLREGKNWLWESANASRQ